MEIPSVITVKQCSDASGLPTCTIYKLIKENKFISFKSGNKYYINADSFAAFLMKGERKDE